MSEVYYVLEIIVWAIIIFLISITFMSYFSKYIEKRCICGEPPREQSEWADNIDFYVNDYMYNFLRAQDGESDEDRLKRVTDVVDEWISRGKK